MSNILAVGVPSLSILLSTARRRLQHHAQAPVWLLSVVLIALVGIEAASQQLGTYRVVFRDKGPGVFLPGSALYRAAERELDTRAIERRKKVLPPDSLVTIEDAPLYEAYLEDVARSGGRILLRLRWRNYAVIECDGATADRLRQKPYIRAVEPTSALLRPQEHSTWWLAQEQPGPYRYGESLEQLAMVGLPSLHALGIAGDGVLVGLIDTGFRWRVHEALRSRHVVAERDFIQLDTNTANEEGDPANQDNHGTAVFSVVAGWYPDSLIGGAPCASFLLAKTENIASERHLEEDALAAALEWLEARGADVVNISLGYGVFDSTEAQYNPSDFDGRTTIASVAVEEAVRRGMICVVAAGNSGDAPQTIFAPADAPSAITVGAVANAQLEIPRFTSRGPTADGRLKPDIAALGVNVRTTTNASPLGFGVGSGTSLATPIITSCVAALLEAHPTLTPAQVRELLQSQASSASEPNTAIGFGVPNVYRSALQWGIVCSPPIIIPQADSVLVGIAATSLTPITSAELTIESTGRTEQIRLGSAGNLHFVRIPRQGNDSLRLWFMLSDGQRTRRHPVTDAFYVRTSDTLLPCGWQRESINAIADSRMQESAPLTQSGIALPLEQPYLPIPQRWVGMRCAVFDLQLRTRAIVTVPLGAERVRLPIEQRGTYLVRFENSDGGIVSHLVLVY